MCNVLEGVLSFINFLKQLNWVDIFTVILLFRICYIATRQGFISEIFKLIGTITAICFACHYYTRLSNLLNIHLSLNSQTGLGILEFFSFIILASIGYLIFVILRVVFSVLIKMEAISYLNRWGAILFASLRWALFSSLLFLIFLVSDISYLKNSLNDSYSGVRISKIAPSVYLILWNSLIYRFAYEDAFNQKVLDINNLSSE